MSKARSGGGITMNKNTVARVTPGATGIDVIGPGKAGAPNSPSRVGGQPPLGNAIASNSRMGPGADRTIHARGSQGHHGRLTEPKKG